MLVNPSPYWNACTATFKSMFKVSAMGFKIGTRIAALEVAEGISRLTTEMIAVIPMLDTARLKPISGLVIA